MPRTADDIESYLNQVTRPYERTLSSEEGGQATFLLHSKDRPVIAIRVSPPVVAIRVDIGRAPTDAAHRLDTFERLLRLNSADLMHAAYSLDGEQIVLVAGLPLDNLDPNELEATLSDIDVALSRHIKDLAHAARS